MKVASQTVSEDQRARRLGKSMTLAENIRALHDLELWLAGAVGSMIDYPVVWMHLHECEGPFLNVSSCKKVDALVSEPPPAAGLATCGRMDVEQAFLHHGFRLADSKPGDRSSFDAVLVPKSGESPSSSSSLGATRTRGGNASRTRHRGRLGS